MKPNFALGLTDDGITLWQRDGAGLLRVGVVALDAPDMDVQMQALVDKARALAPDGIATQLVVPDEQVLYTDIPAQPDDAAIRAALDGKTPYPVDELDFDWQEMNGALRVAVVARETLAEAEDFARAQGLNPVCFVAAPRSQGFTVQPFFGRVRGVKDRAEDLGRGGAIQHEIGIADLPKPKQPQTAPAPKAAPEPTAQANAAPGDSGPAKQDAAADAKPTAKTTKGDVAQDKPDTGEIWTTPATDDIKTDPSKAAQNKFDFARKDELSDAAKAAVAKALSPLKAKPKSPEPAASTGGDDFAAFRSRRAAPRAAPVANPVAAPVAPPSASEAKATKALTALTKSRSLSFGSLGGAALAEKLRASVSAPVSRASSSLWGATARLQRKSDAATRADTPAKAALAHAEAANLATKTPAKDIPKAPKPISKPIAKPIAKPEADPEAERLTVFGARRHGAASEPKLPGRALALSGAGLLLVLAVGVWVFYFTQAQAPELAQPDLPADTATEIAAPEALGIDPPEDDPLTGDAAEDVESSLGVTDAAQNQGSAETPEAPDVEGATSGGSSPEIERQAQSAGRLAALRSTRAIAPEAPGNLPNVQSAPEPFGSTPLPPLRGAETPQVAEQVTEDAVAPEPSLPPGEELLDINVTEGSPTVVPPARPEGIAPEPAPEPTPEPTPEPQAAAPTLLDESDVVVDVTEGAPPSVPPDRPEGIAPDQAAPAETTPEDDAPEDQSSLPPPPGGVALTMLSPRHSRLWRHRCARRGGPMALARPCSVHWPRPAFAPWTNRRRKSCRPLPPCPAFPVLPLSPARPRRPARSTCARSTCWG